MKKTLSLIISMVLALTLCGCISDAKKVDTSTNHNIITMDNVPDFYGLAYVEINNNEPQFTEDEITTVSFEKYSALDYLDRCSTATACIGLDLMPTEERGEIGMVKPTGWHTVKYEVVDGKYLYNRCHLIGYQLSGENANEQNLITGTRFMNIEGMLPFENMIADYVKETGNHVMYRVTPVFESVNLLCKGVQMEGYSVEDEGDGICFNVFAYNAQPQIEINYLTGESRLLSGMLPEENDSSNISVSSITSSSQTVSVEENESMNSNESEAVESETTVSEEESNTSVEESEYIANKNSKKIHLSSCSHAKRMKEENKAAIDGDLEEYLAKGYSKCQVCLKNK